MKVPIVSCLLALVAGIAAAGDLPRIAPDDAQGAAMIVRARVLDENAQPVVGAEVFAYQADHEGEYHDDAYRGTFQTDADGRIAFETARPGGYGPAPHIHFKVTGEGIRDQLATLRLKDEAVPRREVELRGERVEEFTYEIRVRRD